MARQAPGHDPGAGAVVALPLGQEIGQPEAGGAEVGKQGQIEEKVIHTIYAYDGVVIYKSFM